MKRSLSRSALLGLVGLSCISGLAQNANASNVDLESIDQIQRSFQIPITDPTRVNYPSVVDVQSATLNSINPSDSSTVAPADSIYLILNLSSGPIQSQFGNPTWGDFYSNMAPLPATALRYVTTSGRSYVSTRIDVNTQASFANADGDDGLFDATYYFAIPSTELAGTLEILPSRTTGMRYENFDGVETTTLVTGGPVRVAMNFPKPVAVLTTTAPNKVPHGVTAAPYTTFAGMLNFASTVLGVLLLTSAYLWFRCARRRKHRGYRPTYVAHDGPAPNPGNASEPVTIPDPTTTVRSATPTPARIESDDRLHINILGSLNISPTDGPMSDPIRAIVAYLAMHPERPLTLDEVQNAIWPLTDNGNDIKRPAMRNYMAAARKAVGEEHLPTASGRPGYQLVDATTDWSEFQSLTVQSATTDKQSARELRKYALSLVRGEPFTADTSRYFTWAFSSPVVYKIVESVSALAHSLCTDLVLANDLPSAEWALRQGLLCDPSSLTLWEDLTDVLLETADQSLLDVHWKSASLVLSPADVAALRTRESG
jgi:hypothetical protein